MADTNDKGAGEPGTTETGRAYPKVDMTGGTGRGAPHFPFVEQKVLDYWESDGTFAASIANRADAEEFVFYDGPPFANGLPHYGHLLTLSLIHI